MSDIRELLPLYAFGLLDANEAAEVERAIDGDRALAAELESYGALVPAVLPSPDVKVRLLASVGGGRFERFATRLASMFDVSVERARELLGLVEREASWEQPIPGIGLIHFAGGPACSGADCGFVRIAAGCTFPWHTHRGEEANLILAGTIHDQGTLLGPGDELVLPTGTQHDLTAGDALVIYVARVFDGIEVGPRR
jgi:putative transcriptional regulator